MTVTNPIQQASVFDHPLYDELNTARESWLRRVLDEIPFAPDLSTALDLGCGSGHFSAVLASLGYQTTGIDLRHENIDLCKQRRPNCDFLQANLDDPAGLSHVSTDAGFDLVLAFGVLYHLQNPITAIRTLAKQTGRLCIVSTRCSAGASADMHLYTEPRSEDQNTAPIVAVPTRSAYITLFAAAGFTHLYETLTPVDHPEWDPQQTPDGTRFSFIAAREKIDSPHLRALETVQPTPKWFKPSL